MINLVQYFLQDFNNHLTVIWWSTGNWPVIQQYTVIYHVPAPSLVYSHLQNREESRWNPPPPIYFLNVLSIHCFQQGFSTWNRQHLWLSHQGIVCEVSTHWLISLEFGGRAGEGVNQQHIQWGFITHEGSVPGTPANKENCGNSSTFQGGDAFCPTLWTQLHLGCSEDAQTLGCQTSG